MAILVAAPFCFSINTIAFLERDLSFSATEFNLSINYIAHSTWNANPSSMNISASGNLECFGPKKTGSPNTAGSKMLCNCPEKPPPTNATFPK